MTCTIENLFMLILYFSLALENELGEAETSQFLSLVFIINFS